MILRKLLKSDLPFLLEIRNHESTRSLLENDSVFDLKGCESWYDTLSSDWYIVEVKQVDDNRVVDPEFLWFRPFIPIQSNFNEYITISLNYRDQFGAVKDWSRAEMFRIRAMWGA